MPRRARVIKRIKQIDSVYHSELVAKFINKIMYDGKKSKAEGILYSALKKAEDKLKKDGKEIFEKVLANLSPIMEVKSRRVGGSTYQVPIEVSRKRGISLAMQWLRDSARERGRSMENALSEEMLAAYNNTGGAFGKREEMHRMADSNKAFAHLRW